MWTRTILSLVVGSLACSLSLAESAISAVDLQHHRWVLESIDGEPLPALEGKGQIPELDVGEQMTVSGNLGCNRFNGQAVLRDGFFLVESMVTTRMMCAPPWSDIELAIQTALSTESTISLNADRNLTLATAETSLVFRLEDWVAATAATSNTSGGNVARGFHDRGSRTGYTTSPPPFGGPNSPAGEIDEADVEIDPAFRFPSFDAAFDPWNEWKRRQNAENGLQLSAHYSTMFQGVSDSLTAENKASAGILRATARWTLVGEGTPNHGSLNVMLDHRHGFRDETPAGSAATQAGYIGVTSLFYNDQGFSVINLNWQQAFNDGNTGLIVGRYDPMTT